MNLAKITCFAILTLLLTGCQSMFHKDIARNLTKIYESEKSFGNVAAQCAHARNIHNSYIFANDSEMSAKWRGIVENDCGNLDSSKPRTRSIGVNLTPLPASVQQNLATNKGLYIKSVIPDSAAFSANILAGDVILAANGKPINSTNDADLLRAESAVSCSERNPLILTIIRTNNVKLDIPVAVCNK
jgi:S1-C subfamily serine protease